MGEAPGRSTQGKNNSTFPVKFIRECTGGLVVRVHAAFTMFHDAERLASLVNELTLIALTPLVSR